MRKSVLGAAAAERARRVGRGLDDMPSSQRLTSGDSNDEKRTFLEARKFSSVRAAASGFPSNDSR